jgi:hypothetical protein
MASAKSAGYYPYRVGLYLSLAIGLTVLLGSLTVLLIVASIKTSQRDGRSIALTVFGAIGVREIGAWRSYTEVDRHLKDGRVTEQWFARDSRSGPVRTTARGRCSYLVWRSGCSMIWLKPELRHAYELGETILKKAPVSSATRGPDTSTVS